MGLPYQMFSRLKAAVLESAHSRTMRAIMAETVKSSRKDTDESYEEEEVLRAGPARLPVPLGACHLTSQLHCAQCERRSPRRRPLSSSYTHSSRRSHRSYSQSHVSCSLISSSTFLDVCTARAKPCGAAERQGPAHNETNLAGRRGYDVQIKDSTGRCRKTAIPPHQPTF